MTWMMMPNIDRSFNCVFSDAFFALFISTFAFTFILEQFNCFFVLALFGHLGWSVQYFAVSTFILCFLWYNNLAFRFTLIIVLWMKTFVYSCLCLSKRKLLMKIIVEVLERAKCWAKFRCVIMIRFVGKRKAKILVSCFSRHSLKIWN